MCARQVQLRKELAFPPLHFQDFNMKTFTTKRHQILHTLLVFTITAGRVPTPSRRTPCAHLPPGAVAAAAGGAAESPWARTAETTMRKRKRMTRMTKVTAWLWCESGRHGRGSGRLWSRFEACAHAWLQAWPEEMLLGFRLRKPTLRAPPDLRTAPRTFKQEEKGATNMRRAKRGINRQHGM